MLNGAGSDPDWSENADSGPLTIPALYGSAGPELAVGVGEAAAEPGAGVVAGADRQRDGIRQRHVVPLPGGQRP